MNKQTNKQTNKKKNIRFFGLITKPTLPFNSFPPGPASAKWVRKAETGERKIENRDCVALAVNLNVPCQNISIQLADLEQANQDLAQRLVRGGICTCLFIHFSPLFFCFNFEKLPFCPVLLQLRAQKNRSSLMQLKNTARRSKRR